jgi:archaellum biogenesis protein FlaJ (TadC family)
VTTPSTWQQLRYLSGSTAPPEHREWLETELRTADERSLGARSSIINAVMVLILAVLELLTDLRIGLALLVGAVLIVASGAYVGSVRRSRMARIRRRNGFAPG